MGLKESWQKIFGSEVPEPLDEPYEAKSAFGKDVRNARVLSHEHKGWRLPIPMSDNDELNLMDKGSVVIEEEQDNGSAVWWITTMIHKSKILGYRDEGK